MRSVSATDAKQRLAALLDAAQREPIMIRRQNREVAVIMSPEHYHRLSGLTASKFGQFCDRVMKDPSPNGLRDIVMIRNVHLLLGKPIPTGRFAIFRVHGANPPRQHHESFWSLDSEELAKDLCCFLVTSKLGAYVLDTLTEKKILELKASGR